MNAISRSLRWGLLLGTALLGASLSGCHKNQPAVTDAINTGDPADANLAASDGSVPGSPADPSQQQPSQQLTAYPQGYPPTYPSRSAAAPRGRVLSARAQNESQGQAEEYSPQQSYPDNSQGAPIERRAPKYNDGNGYNQANTNGQNTGDYDTYDQGYNTGMDAVEEADQPPPPLPVYDQPPCPEPNYLWTPGYWNYASADYYWVPGAWTAPPYYGALWTPGYWGYYGHRYRFHHGFWGPHIGFYGGVAYGFGYTGYGYQGGYWRGNQFQYNRAVTRVNTTNITNVYNRTVIINNNTTVNRVSYNGGNGGLQVRPQPAELAALHETRIPPMQSQVQLRQTAATNRQQFFAANGGRPATVVAARPLAATPGIPPPAVRLPSANAPRPEVTPGRPNLPVQQQQASGQRLNPGQQQPPANQQHLTPTQQQQVANQQRLTQQQPANQQRFTPAQQQQLADQQRLNLQQQQLLNQQRLTPQQQIQQQRGVAQQQVQQGRLNAQQQADQQRVNAQQQQSRQAEQQQRVNAPQQANQQRGNVPQQQTRPAEQPRSDPQPQPAQTAIPRLQARPQIQPRPETMQPQNPGYRPGTAQQPRPAPVQQPRPAEARPEMQDRPQPSRAVAPQPTAPQTVRPIDPTGRPQYQPQPAARPQYQPQPAARPQYQPQPAARPQPQPSAPHPQAQPAPRAEAPRANEARPH